MEIMLDLGDEITYARTYLERAETVLGGVVEEYFEVLVNNPDTPIGRENIALGFNQNRIMSTIVRDYLIQLRQTLVTMETLVKESIVNDA